MRLKKILMLLITFLFLIIVLLTVTIIKKFDTSKKLSFASRIENIREYNVGTNEIIGWIQVEGTNVDSPVTRSKYITSTMDEEDLNHAWESGEFVNGQNRRAIFGHNLKNVSSKPKIADPTHSKFEQLMSFVDYNFAKKNQYIQYTANGKDEIYKIFAVGFYYPYQETGLSFKKEDMNAYISGVKRHSIYDYDIEVDENDEIISLITCTRYFGLDGETQFKIDARKIRKNEKIEKYRIEKSKNYDIIK